MIFFFQINHESVHMLDHVYNFIHDSYTRVMFSLADNTSLALIRDMLMIGKSKQEIQCETNLTMTRIEV